MKEVMYSQYCYRCAHYKNLIDPMVEKPTYPCEDCITTPARENSEKPLYFSPIYSEQNYKGYYKSIQKIKDYLYYIKYTDLDYDAAYEYFDRLKDIPQPTPPACSAIRKDNLYGRNYDWYYSNQAEFVVEVPRLRGHYRSIGMAGGFAKLTNEFVNSGKYADDYRILPFLMQDGINERGLVVSTNVVPTDYGPNYSVHPRKTRRATVSSLMLVRYLLDRFANAYDAAYEVIDHLEVTFPKVLHNSNYEMHFMIADKEKTYAVEFINGEGVVIDITNRPYMTNFHLYGVKVNIEVHRYSEDGIRIYNGGYVYTPETQVGYYNAETVNHITRNGSGLERFNYISSAYDSISSYSDMRHLLDQLSYTRSYKSAPNVSDPYWYTEFVGSQGLTVSSKVEDFQDVVDTAAGYYTDRTRTDGRTWQTMHSCVYDISKKSFIVVTQEDGVEYSFWL